MYPLTQKNSDEYAESHPKCRIWVGIHCQN